MGRRPHSYITEFGRRETPLFSDKPFVLDPEEHQRFLSLSDAVSCSYLRVCFGSTSRAREVVESGMFGAFERVVCREGGIQGATGQSSNGFRANEELMDRHMLLDRAYHGLRQLPYAIPDGELAAEETEMTWEPSEPRNRDRFRHSPSVSGSVPPYPNRP